MKPRVILCRKQLHPRVPTLLHICRESRKEGLRHYQVHYWEPNGTRAVYFNVELDTLFVTARSLHDAQNAVELLSDNPAISQIHHLAISVSFGGMIIAQKSYDFYARIRESKGLKTLTVVQHASELKTDEPQLVEDHLPLWLRTVVQHSSIGTSDFLHDGTKDRPEWKKLELKYAHVAEDIF